MSNVIGFDYGERRIGVAVGLLDIATANPLTTITVPASGMPWNEIDQIMAQWQPETLVVGHIEHGTQNNNLLHGKIRRFCKSLRTRYDVPIEAVDEAYSSATAYEMLKDMRSKGQRGKIKKTDIDKASAAIILHSWLSSDSGQSKLRL